MKLALKRFCLVLAFGTIIGALLESNDSSRHKTADTRLWLEPIPRNLSTISDIILDPDSVQTAASGFSKTESKKISMETYTYYQKTLKLNDLIHQFKKSMQDIELIKANHVTKIKQLLKRLGSLHK